MAGAARPGLPPGKRGQRTGGGYEALFQRPRLQICRRANAADPVSRPAAGVSRVLARSGGGRAGIVPVPGAGLGHGHGAPLLSGEALRRRPARGLLAKLWEYPNEPAPAPCPVEAAALADGPAGKHIFSHIEWRMRSVVVQAAGPELPPGWVWADGEALRAEYAVPNAFRSFAKAVEERLKDVKKPITVAVMGCVVNGPGEAREADIGIAGGDGWGMIFEKGEQVEKLPYDELLPALLKRIEAL